MPPYAAAPYGPPPGYVVQPPVPRPVQAPAPVHTAQGALPPPAVVRGQAPDSVTMVASVAPVAMPSPDKLGVGGRPADGASDWTAIHRRIQELGVVSFQADQLSAEVYQFTCLMPTAEAGRTHRIEGHGATQAEAARRALDEAQRWRDQARRD